MKKVFSLVQRRRVMIRNKNKQLIGTSKILGRDCGRPEWFRLLSKLDEAIAQSDEATELCIKQNQQAAKARLI